MSPDVMASIEELDLPQPTPRPHALYRFFNAEDELLYVGITVNPGTRWTAHQDKPWWTEMARATVDTFPNRQAALIAERRAIEQERPRYNIIHSLGYSPLLDDDDDDETVDDVRILIRVEDAVYLLGLSPQSVSKLCHRGDLRARKWGTRWLICRRSVDEFAAAFLSGDVEPC